MTAELGNARTGREAEAGSRLKYVIKGRDMREYRCGCDKLLLSKCPTCHCAFAKKHSRLPRHAAVKVLVMWLGGTPRNHQDALDRPFQYFQLKGTVG